MTRIEIRLPDIESVKDFVRIMNHCPAEAEVRVGKYKVDAKSIMGLFSLDLDGSIVVAINADTNDVMETIADLNKYQVNA